MNKRQSGFTLIELVMVIVILGILAALAVPRFVDVGTQATASAQSQIQGATKSAFAAYLAENQSAPTLTQLAGFVQADPTPVVTTAADGIAFGINPATAGNFNYVVNTFTDNACTTATAAAGDTVLCIQGGAAIAETATP